MNKFNVGDIVVVNENYNGYRNIIGVVGKIAEINECDMYSYIVKFPYRDRDNENPRESYGFTEKELNLVSNLEGPQVGDRVRVNDIGTVKRKNSDDSLVIEISGITYRFNPGVSYEVVVD